MGKYFTLKVKQVIRETEDAFTIEFENPEEPMPYKAGQFLTLILEINGEKLRRSYSLCTAAEIDEYPAVTVKRVLHGKVSNFLADNVKAGDRIEVMEPMGIFTLVPDYHKKRDVVLIGAGSGITPLMAIAKSVLYKEPLSTVYLIYGNRNENSIIFRDKLKTLKEEHKDRLQLVDVLSQPIQSGYPHSGRLNRSSIIKLLEANTNLNITAAEFYICGPKGMMEEAEEALGILNVPAHQVHRESFLSTPTEAGKGEVVEDNQAGPNEVIIIYQGTEYKFVVPAEKSILEAALDQDIDLPFSCQSGMCTACMGKCISGKVHLNDPDGLSQREIEQGFVLTCVGHPVSNDVVIEID